MKTIPNQSPAQTIPHSRTAPMTARIRFQNLLILKSTKKKQKKWLSSPRALKPTSQRGGEATLRRKTGRRCSNGSTHCAQSWRVCISQCHAALIIHAHARTRKTARKPKRTHLDKQTQAERERVELFWQMFACYHLRHSSQTNKLVITAMLHMRLEPSHSVCFLFLLLTMSPVFLSLPPSLTA